MKNCHGILLPKKQPFVYSLWWRETTLCLFSLMERNNLVSILFDGKKQPCVYSLWWKETTLCLFSLMERFFLRFLVLVLRSLVVLATYQSARITSLNLVLMDTCHRLQSCLQPIHSVNGRCYLSVLCCV